MVTHIMFGQQQHVFLNANRTYSTLHSKVHRHSRRKSKDSNNDGLDRTGSAGKQAIAAGVGSEAIFTLSVDYRNVETTDWAGGYISSHTYNLYVPKKLDQLISSGG